MSRQASLFLFGFWINPPPAGSTSLKWHLHFRSFWAKLHFVGPPRRGGALNRSPSVRSAAGSRVLWESRRHPVRKQMWPRGSASGERGSSARPGREVRVCWDSSHTTSPSTVCQGGSGGVVCMGMSARFRRLPRANICVHIHDILLDTPSLKTEERRAAAYGIVEARWIIQWLLISLCLGTESNTSRRAPQTDRTSARLWICCWISSWRGWSTAWTGPGSPTAPSESTGAWKQRCRRAPRRANAPAKAAGSRYCPPGPEEPVEGGNGRQRARAPPRLWIIYEKMRMISDGSVVFWGMHTNRSTCMRILGDL